MTDDELKIEFERRLTELAAIYRIRYLAERNSYFTYDVKDGHICYHLPDMKPNDFILAAIELVQDFREEM